MTTLEGRMFREEPGEDDRPRVVLTPEAQRAYLAHVNGTCPGCPECDPEWPTKAQVEAQVRAETAREAAQKRQERLRAWRKANPLAICDDVVAGLLADLEDRFGRGQERGA